MGRKSIRRERKGKNKKVEQWTQALLSKLKNIELGDLTIDDLARLMGKSKSTIYQYFTTKEEIFEYITQVRVDRIKDYKKEISGELSVLNFQYESLAKILAEGVEDISPFYLKQLQTHYSGAWNIVEQFLQELLKDLKNFYVFGIENKMFKTVSPELLIKMDEYFIMQLLTDHTFFDNNQQTLESAIKEYMYIKFEGLVLN
ncbi:TetR/AcrR family transcriptional regulator [Aquimarina sp. 2201CG14-23]|uniref:TetR/AcrR family transcriptional regulator n=1 Tax=Aquimarina mycalae TaxID=3040073 RepID=UPI002477E67D|nr:TetR/AcrR family transcriptional regulator [Aquimarina sp. 2201CG14-23]MDH7444052.1 TetR/AcrR family transcriptional regulator [Aquimarina sp. 2201CG14-23]